MMKNKGTTSNIMVGKNSSTSTVSKTSVHHGKFGSKGYKNTESITVNRDGEVLSKRSINSMESSVHITSGMISSTIAVLFGALVLINFFNILLGVGDYRGFEWLLNVLSNAPEIPVGWISTLSSVDIGADWPSILQPLANVLGLFQDLFSVVLYLVMGALNIISFVSYLIGSFIFVGI